MKKILIKSLSLMLLTAMTISVFCLQTIAAVTQHNNSWYLNNIPTNNTTDKSPFICLKGDNGVYTEPLSNLKDLNGNKCWTDAGEKQPWVAPWFISATTGADGVVSFIAPNNGTAEIKSSVDIKLETSGGNNSDGLEFMVVQKSTAGFYPLFPTSGKWEWKKVDNSTSFKLAGVKTFLKAGDQILYIVRSTGTPTNDTLMIDPQVAFDDSASEGGEYKRPTSFSAWKAGASDPNPHPSSNTGNTTPSQNNQNSSNASQGGSAIDQQNSSWYIDNTKTNSFTDTNPFVYLKGDKGVYKTPLTNLKTGLSGHNAWTDEGEKQPWIAPWFMSATTGADGVVSFVAPVNGTAEIKSAVDVQLETSGGDMSDGLNFMIVQKSKDGYYPLYPSKGEWKWQSFGKGTTVKLSNIKTYVNAGDEIMYIVHSVGTPTNDTLQIDPQILYGRGAKANAEFARPTAFGAWNGDKSSNDLNVAKQDNNKLWLEAAAKLPEPTGKIDKSANETGKGLTKDSNSKNDTSSNKSSNSILLITGIVAGVIILGVVITLIILNLKKKKTGSLKS